jgi:hypothetical protein
MKMRMSMRRHLREEIITMKTTLKVVLAQECVLRSNHRLRLLLEEAEPLLLWQQSLCLLLPNLLLLLSQMP